MAKIYYLTSEETCPECNGKRRIHNPDWIAMGQYLDQWRKDNPKPPHGSSDEQYQAHRDSVWQAERSWWNDHGYDVTDDARGLPWDECECDECAGRGVITRQVELAEALKDVLPRIFAALSEEWLAESERLRAKAEQLREEGCPANAARVGGMSDGYARCASQLKRTPQ